MVGRWPLPSPDLLPDSDDTAQLLATAAIDTQAI